MGVDKDLERDVLVDDLDPLLVIKLSLENHEIAYMIRNSYIKMVREYRGNVSKLIRVLGIPRQTFYSKIHKYAIDLDSVRRGLS